MMNFMKDTKEAINTTELWISKSEEKPLDGWITIWWTPKRSLPWNQITPTKWICRFKEISPCLFPVKANYYAPISPSIDIGKIKVRGLDMIHYIKELKFHQMGMTSISHTLVKQLTQKPQNMPKSSLTKTEYTDSWPKKGTY